MEMTKALLHVPPFEMLIWKGQNSQLEKKIPSPLGMIS